MIVPRAWVAALTCTLALGAAPCAATPELGPLAVSPASRVLSVRVGEKVDFTAAAAGARTFTWSLWGRPVSQQAAWSFVPGPTEAGWQQITVVVVGDAGARVEQTWDVGVVAATEPTLLQASPSPGRVALELGAKASFRCDARVAAARRRDRVRFEWAVDDRPVRRHEDAAASASSRFTFAADKAGSHRLSVRVWEEERAPLHVEWTVDVVGVPARVPEKPGELPGPFQPRLTRTPAARELSALRGDDFRFTSGVTPALPRVRFVWTVDGEPVQRGSEARFDYTADVPGEHRVTVAVTAAETLIGSTSWTIDVEDYPPPPSPTATATP